MAVFAKILSGTTPPASHSTLEIQFVDDNGNPVDVGGGSTSITVDAITDATATGKTLLKATDGATVRKTIGAGTSNFSGSYNDLTNKPTIPAAATAATTTALGLVRQAASVADTATMADLLTALRTAGIMAPKA